MVESAPVPAAGAVVAFDVPFHVAYDVAFLSPHGDTVFFRNFAAFADGRPKRRPEECNLAGGGSCFPAGTLKKISGLSVQVLGARDEDLFEVDVLVSKQLQKSLTLCSGMRQVAQVDPGVVVRGQEWLEVHLRAPEHLRAERAYARVTLHGLLVVAGYPGEGSVVDAAAAAGEDPPA